MDFVSKIREFEKRIKSLELKNAQANFNYVRFQSRGQESQEQTFAFNFKTLKKCVLKLKFIITARYAPGKSGSIKINGVKYKDFLPKNGKTEIDCFVPFEKGVQTATLSLVDDEEFEVDTCEFETFGCVDYPENDSELSVINESSRSVILFVHDKVASLIEYDGANLNERATYSGVTAAAIFTYSEGYALACAYKTGELKTHFLSSDFTETTAQVLASGGIISVCAFGGDEPCYYAVKGSKVLKYSFDKQNKSFALSATDYRGKKVTSNPAVEGYLIITGFDGTNKLISL